MHDPEGRRGPRTVTRHQTRSLAAGSEDHAWPGEGPPPEDLTRLFVEHAQAGDAAGIASLYETGAVMAYPPGAQTTGREAIRALWEKVLANAPRFEPESPLPTLVSGDIALTATVARDGTGVRVQVARRQPDGTWLRLLDQPELSPDA